MLSLKLPQLLQVHQVPRVFWEDGIMSGYRRPTSSALDCVLSSFQMTNETVNIWTHFLPTWYFLWRLLALAGGPGFRAEPYHWPLLVFLLPACLYPFASCCAHTFSSMSPRARHICYFLDYGALSLYSLGCAFPYAAYSMPASWLHGRLHQFFVPAAALNSFLCTGLSCYSRFLELESPGLSKVLRTGAFAYPFLFDNLPLFYRLGLCWGRGHGCGQEALSTSHGYHLFCALLTGFLFASHLPERLAPGRFDYIGEGTPGPAREEAGADAFPEHRMNWATATSYSTSVQCWAPTSSWRQCWLIWDHAEPGWPHKNLLWAWQAQWPHWSWLQLGTYSLLLLSQPPCFGPPVHALCCRVAHWRGVPRPNNSEAPSLTLSWRGQRPGPSADEEPRFGPNQVGTHLSLEPTGAEERGHRREGREEEGCLGGLAECERDREGALDGSGRSAEGLRGEMHACPG
nr:membrane progestin receptor delta isoform X3 [Pan paniscus]